MFGCCPGMYDSDNSYYSDDDDDDEDDDELDDEILQSIARSFRKKYERKPTEKGMFLLHICNRRCGIWFIMYILLNKATSDAVEI